VERDLKRCSQNSVPLVTPVPFGNNFGTAVMRVNRKNLLRGFTECGLSCVLYMCYLMIFFLMPRYIYVILTSFLASASVPITFVANLTIQNYVIPSLRRYLTASWVYKDVPGRKVNILRGHSIGHS
jgi:hypothetical protein